MAADYYELMIRVEAEGACPTCYMSMDHPFLSGTGASRSLLPWWYCDLCKLWVAVCNRGSFPHLLIFQPDPIQFLHDFIAGGEATPPLGLVEQKSCLSRGHYAAVFLN